MENTFNNDLISVVTSTKDEQRKAEAAAELRKRIATLEKDLADSRTELLEFKISVLENIKK